MRALFQSGVAAAATLIGIAETSAADIIKPVRVAPPAVVAPVADWSGHYWGIQLGWANVRGQIDDSFFNQGSGFTDGTPANAFLLGGKLGHNFQTRGRLVLGVEADATAVFGEDVFCTAVNCADYNFAGGPMLSFNVLGVGSLAARIGWAHSDRSMLYGLIGVAAGAVTTNDWYNANVDGSTHLFTGWTAGLGWDRMVSNNISVGVEGRYYDLGSQYLTDAANFTFGWHPILWSVTVGAKHHF